MEEGMADSPDWQPQGLSSYGADSCGRGGTTSTGLKALGKPFPRGDLSFHKALQCLFWPYRGQICVDFQAYLPNPWSALGSQLWRKQYPWVSPVPQRPTMEEDCEASMDWLPSPVVEEGSQLPPS